MATDSTPAVTPSPRRDDDEMDLTELRETAEAWAAVSPTGRAVLRLIEERDALAAERDRLRELLRFGSESAGPTGSSNWNHHHWQDMARAALAATGHADPEADQ